MQEFNPPIANRNTDELVHIAHDTQFEFWSKDAVEQAEAELQKRNILPEDRVKFLRKSANRQKQIFQHSRKEFKARASDTLSINEIIRYVFFWPRNLFNDWYFKQDGYLKKAKQRKIAFAAGFVFYAICIAFVYIEADKKQETERQEIQDILAKDSAYQQLKRRTPHMDK